jgi:uncharacterized Rmd1/YagE family protein
MVMRTTLRNNINISANGSFSLYGVDSTGRPIATYAFAQNRKLMRLTNFSTSLDFSLSELLKGKEGNTNSTAPQAGSASTQGLYENQLPGPDLENIRQPALARDQYGYAEFDVPWSLNVNYTLYYSKSLAKPTITQSLSLNGFLTLTKKMNITYTTGYDFTGKAITMTNIGITRDLHCWEMSMNWIPNGTMKMWNFTLRVKASVLQDLKVERRKDFHDIY